MKLHSFKWVVVLSLLPVITSATDDSVSFSYDTAYIRDVSDKLAVRILGVNKFNRFSIVDHALTQEVLYAPNRNLNLGFGVNYKWFGLGVAFNLPFINNDDELYGKTSRFDAQTNIVTQKFLIDVYLHQYKGFYVENPESYLVDWDVTKGYPQRPDITTAAFGGSFTYIFNNKKFSAKSAFVQNQFQKKSAGSFLLGGFFSVNALRADSSMIPFALSASFNPDLQFNSVQSSSLGVAAGYTHNFVVWKKLYFSITLVPGVAVQGYTVGYDDPEKSYEGSDVVGRLMARLALVYNTEKSFAGVTANNDSFGGNASEESNNALNFEVGVVRFFYGRRFSIGGKSSHPTSSERQ